MLTRASCKTTRFISTLRNRRLKHILLDIVEKAPLPILLSKLVEGIAIKSRPVYPDTLDIHALPISNTLEFTKLMRAHLYGVASPSAVHDTIVISCPFKGAELMLQQLARSTAIPLDATFHHCCNRDIFPRLSGTAAFTSPPVCNTVSTSFSKSKNQEKKSPAVIGINLIELGLGGDKRNDDQRDTVDVPYPWFTGYGDARTLLSSRLGDDTSSSSHLPAMFKSAFQTYFDRLNASLVDKQPLFVFYEDFLSLLDSDELVDPADILLAIQQSLVSMRLKRKVVLIIPSTATHESKKVDAEPSGIATLFQHVGKKQGGPQPHQEESRPTVNYDTKLDSFFGITLVNVYPRLSDMQMFTTRVASDYQEICRMHNYEEIILAMSPFIQECCSFEAWAAELTRINSELGIHSSTLDSTFINVSEAERINLLAHGQSEKVVSLTLDSVTAACKQFIQASLLKQQLQFGDQNNAFKSNPAVFATLTKHEKRIMHECFVAPSKIDSFANVGGLDKIKQTIDDLIRLPLRRPDLFQTGILLFGPPGTGKTLLARAIAAESGASFLNVQMSSVTSMWVGESEKNVRAIFSLARKLAPCVLFIDELDALLKARQSSQATHTTSTINEFMQEWDGIKSGAAGNGGVIIVGATNRPFDLDEAVLRRLPRRVLIDMPELAERKAILAILLKDEVVESSCGEDEVKGLEMLIEEVAKRTNMYSGSDLKNLCIAAAMHGLRDQIKAEGLEITARKLSLQHFIKSFELGDVVPSMNDKAQLFKQIKDWDLQYGTGATGYNNTWGFLT